MMYEFIAVERENALTIITINRPAVHNALNAAAHRGLEAAFDAFEADGEQWVAILTGAGEEAMVAKWEYPAMKAMLAPADFIEGPLAFAEKRAPRWNSHTP